MFWGSVVQGTIGFALGMIAVPLLVEAGFSLSQAVALTTLSIGIQVLFGAWQLRAHIPWDDVKLAAVVRFLTVAIGVWLLLTAESMDTAAVKQLVGLGVLLGVGVRLVAGKFAQRDWPPVASIAMFGISGVLQGLIAMGGPATGAMDDDARISCESGARFYHDTLPPKCAGSGNLAAVAVAEHEPRCDHDGAGFDTADLPRHDDRRTYRQSVFQASIE